MNKRIGIFIFHNDLRLRDNIGLIQLMSSCDLVVPVFIFTPEQIGSSNKYRSIPAIMFMVSQLDILDAELKSHGSKLHMYFGNTTAIVSKLITATGASIVANNANYTPFALERDRDVESICNKHGCEYILTEDYGMYPINKFVAGTGGVYKKFTPYYNTASKVKPELPLINKHSNYFSGTIKNVIGAVNIPMIKRKLNINKTIDVKNANTVLKSISNFKSYNKDRSCLAIPTTHMSVYIKFGAVSMREVYWTAKDTLGKGASDLIKQLYWREFYMNVAWAYPHVYGRNFNLNFHANWKTAITSPTDKAQLTAWCLGKTGFPVVDACMRELNNTGYMHNRGRLIVAAFLTKVLGWHWRFGERYFATKLFDYDPAQNNGNWQFVAGSGVDQQPYFRMFNPWLQGAKLDPNCIYIKKWCPEYKDFPNAVLHDQKKLTNFITSNGIKNVILPIISYETARDKTRKRYSRKKTGVKAKAKVRSKRKNTKR